MSQVPVDTYIQAISQASIAEEQLRDQVLAMMKTTAIVCFLDMSGSTRLCDNDEQNGNGITRNKYHPTVGKLFAVVKAHVEQQNEEASGLDPKLQVAKTTGDGVMLVRQFEENGIRSDQVMDTCAVVIALVDRLRRADVKVKAAVGAGEALVSGSDLQKLCGIDQEAPQVPIGPFDMWGSPVNRAARMESLAGSSQVLVDEGIARTIVQHVAALECPQGLIITPTGHCPRACADGRECAVRPRCKLVVSVGGAGGRSGQVGYPFSLKGLGDDAIVNQVVTQDETSLTEDQHLVSNYRFGALVLFRCPAYSGRGDDGKAKFMEGRIMPAFASAFPDPMTGAVFRVLPNSIARAQAGLAEQTLTTYHEELSVDFAAILLATDFHDFVRRMAVLSEHDLFSYTSSHVLVTPMRSGGDVDRRRDDEDPLRSFGFTCTDMVGWDRLADAHHTPYPCFRWSFPEVCHLWAVKLRDQKAAFRLIKAGGQGTGFAKRWITVGHHDLVGLDGYSTDPSTAIDDFEDESKARNERSRLFGKVTGLLGCNAYSEVTHLVGVRDGVSEARDASREEET